MFRARSLQAQTLLRVMPASVVAIAAIWALLAISAREQHREQVIETLKERLTSKAELMRNAFSDVATSVRNVARNSISVGALVGQDIERVVQPFLESLILTGVAEHRAAILGYDGGAIVSTAPLGYWSDPTAAEMDWLDAALSGQETAALVGGTLRIVAPIRLGAAPEGALVVTAPVAAIVGGRLGPDRSRTSRVSIVPLSPFEPMADAFVVEESDGRLAGGLTVAIPGLPSLGVRIETTAGLIPFSQDPVQRFLALVFLFCAILLGAGLVVATGRVIAPVRRLIQEVEAQGVRIRAPSPDEPQEIDKLARRFAAAGREIDDALRQEKELSARQRQFVSMVSHEFRTPLAIIDAAAGRLHRRRAAMTEERIDAAVDKIRRSARRLVRLMESTLTASQLEAGAVAPVRVDVDLRALVNDLVTERLAICGSAVIEADLEGLPKKASADEGLVYSALDNLVSNAIKYSRGEPVVHVRGWTEGRRAYVAVTDQGVGIPQDEIAHIGERFFRARTSTGVAGTGVGVSLVRFVAESHGGSLTVVSKEGVGSTFTMSIEIDPALADAPMTGDDGGRLATVDAARSTPTKAPAPAL